MKILATIKKEWLLLWRDKIGLVILFILPMCLVLFISMTTTNQGGNDKQNQKLNILLLNQDHGAIAQGFTTALNKVSLFKVTIPTDNKHALQTAKNAVTHGDYQIAIVIPTGTTRQINRYLQTQLKKPNVTLSAPDPIQLYLDPGIQVQVKNSILMSLQLITSQIETATMAQLLGQTLRQPHLVLNNNFIGLKTNYVNLDDDAKSPNSVQYNVPAWTLFGMF
ncbi:MAG: ABC transporter permease, partial [Gammaproteobacteria bacterium]